MDRYRGETAIAWLEDGSGCATDLAERADRVAAKVAAYTGEPGYVVAFAWAWQPGNGASECEFGNLDADEAAQEVLRTGGS